MRNLELVLLDVRLSISRVRSVICPIRSLLQSIRQLSGLSFMVHKLRLSLPYAAERLSVSSLGKPEFWFLHVSSCVS